MHALTGDWNVKITSAMGDRDAVWKLDCENGAIIGSVWEKGKESGKVDESIILSDTEFAFKTKIKLPFGSLPFTMEGKIDGDKISGTAKMPMGVSNFEGSK
jgi:hypothetical protein